jgi:ABC-type Mn2+/Zn2+ transport system permease subunit
VHYLTYLLEPFRYGFMWHGFAAALLVGIVCGPLGVYVVMRRLAFVGDGLAHAILPGLVLATVGGISLIAGGIVAAVLAAAAIAFTSGDRNVGEDSAIGLVFTSWFALGIILLERLGGLRSLHHLLFGNILAVTTSQLIIMATLAAGVLLTFGLLRKQFDLITCDEEYASSVGCPTSLVRFALLFLLALTVVVVTQLVGVVLTSALLITPALTARMLAGEVSRVLWLAAAVACGVGCGGLYLSYLLNTSSGATIVLTATTLFLAVRLILGRRRSLI